MCEIYKTASHVYIWFDDSQGQGQGKRAIETIRAMTKRNDRQPGARAIEYPVGDADEIKRNWIALEGFFNKSWWERCWVSCEFHQKVVSYS